MSTPSTSLPRGIADGLPATRRDAPRWLREPLLHFVLIGAALFALDHALLAQRDDPRQIVIDARVDADAAELFRAARGRLPDADERRALRRTWLDNEVLYREGLALGVDKGDSAIRERVIFKALSVVDANDQPPPADTTRLRAWFEQHRARYDEPARFDFEEAVLPGDAGEAAVQALADTLAKGQPGEIEAGLRVFKGRPRANLVEGYGEDFTRAFEQAEPGRWRAWRTRGRLRAMRLVALAPPQPAQFEKLLPVVRQDWVDATMSEQRTAAVRALAQKYRLRYDGVAP